MPLDIIEKTCVRVAVLENGKITKQGSGVIITFDDKFYVLTASHCLGMADLKNILIEKQKTYNSDFETLEVKSIKKLDVDNDWVLLEIDPGINVKIYPKCLLASNFNTDELIHFCGYQSIVNNEYRRWEGKVLHTSKLNFKVKLVEDTFQQGGEDGKFIAKGLSGSGVYVIKNKIPYLIGILCSVKTEKAFNDDIDCCSVVCLTDLIGNYCDLSKIIDDEIIKESTYTVKHSRYSKRFEKLNKEVADDVRYEKVLDELKNYLTKKDGIGLKQKLTDGGFTSVEINRASERKQLYWKKHEKNKFYESAQWIDSHLFAKIKIDFETHIEPLINKDESKEKILSSIVINIINPILQLLNEEGAEDEILNYNAEEIYGMIYHLTGKCHLNWKNYDNI